MIGGLVNINSRTALWSKIRLLFEFWDDLIMADSFTVSIEKYCESCQQTIERL